MNVGDLVRYKKVHPRKKLGIIVSLMDPDWEKVDPCQWPAVKIMWISGYGMFWTRIQELEIVNECR